MSTTSTEPSAGRSSKTSSGTSGQAAIRVRFCRFPTRSTRWLARDRRRRHQELRGQGHVAGDAAEQVCGALPAELQVEGTRDFERRPDGSAGDPGHFGDAARPAPVLHRTGQVDVAHHQQAARGGRLLDRHPALFEPVRARDRQQRGTPAWFATATHLNTTTSLRTVAGQYQPVVLSEPGQRRRLADVRHGIAHRQDRHAVGIRVQRLRQRHERRLVAELPEFRNGADSGVGHRLQLAPQHVSGAEGQHRPVCPGPVDLQQGHHQLWDSLRIPEGGDPGPGSARRTVRARDPLRRHHLQDHAGDDLLVDVVTAAGCGLRSVRQRQDGAESQFRPLPAARRQHVCESIQPGRPRVREPYLDRRRPLGSEPADQRRRHRPGQRNRSERQPELREDHQSHAGSELHARIQPAVQRRDPARAQAGDGGHASIGTAGRCSIRNSATTTASTRSTRARTPTGRLSRSSTH